MFHCLGPTVFCPIHVTANITCHCHSHRSETEYVSLFLTHPLSLFLLLFLLLLCIRQAFTITEQVGEKKNNHYNQSTFSPLPQFSPCAALTNKHMRARRPVWIQDGVSVTFQQAVHPQRQHLFHSLPALTGSSLAEAVAKDNCTACPPQEEDVFKDLFLCTSRRALTEQG